MHTPAVRREVAVVAVAAAAVAIAVAAAAAADACVAVQQVRQADAAWLPERAPSPTP